MTSLNGARGDVVLNQQQTIDGVSVSSGATPTVSLNTIAPSSINTPGTIRSGGAFTGQNASFGTLTTGHVSCPSLNTTAGITAATITTPEASAVSATISGAVTAGTFAVPGTLTAATLTNGSLGALPPVALSYDTPSSYQMNFSGWFLQWGVSGPSGTVDGSVGTIRVQFGPYAVYTGDYVLVAFPVNVAGQAPFVCFCDKPGPEQFYIRCQKTDGTPLNGVVVTWMAIGKPLY